MHHDLPNGHHMHKHYYCTVHGAVKQGTANFLLAQHSNDIIRLLDIQS